VKKGGAEESLVSFPFVEVRVSWSRC
jgi:hypothetical protein